MLSSLHFSGFKGTIKKNKDYYQLNGVLNYDNNDNTIDIMYEVGGQENHWTTTTDDVAIASGKASLLNTENTIHPHARQALYFESVYLLLDLISSGLSKKELGLPCELNDLLVFVRKIAKKASQQKDLFSALRVLSSPLYKDQVGTLPNVKSGRLEGEFSCEEKGMKVQIIGKPCL